MNINRFGEGIVEAKNEFIGTKCRENKKLRNSLEKSVEEDQFAVSDGDKINIKALLNECNLNNVNNILKDKTMSIINNEKYEAISTLDNSLLFFIRSTLKNSPSSNIHKINFSERSVEKVRDSLERSVGKDQLAVACEGKYDVIKVNCSGKGVSEAKHEEISEVKRIKIELCKKMIGFQYIFQISDLILGRTIKMIRIDDCKFCFAGVLLNIKFTNNGTIIVCKICPKGNVLNYSFDKYLVFQKLNKDEEMILSLQEYLQISS
jgi:hypothetical protein